MHGGILFFRLYPWVIASSWDFFWMSLSSWDFIFAGTFLVLMICLIMLKCIIKDAEEDLTAIMKLKNDSETHFGNRDMK